MKRIFALIAFASLALAQQRNPPTITPVTIGVLNQSSTPNATVQAWIAAIQSQVSNEFRQAWHLNATIVFGEGGDWQCVIQDVNGPIHGTHDATSGIPKCMATSSASLSHEIMEMLVDPYLDAIGIQELNGVTANLFLREICDPVSMFGYYGINGVILSDFTYPAFWGHGSGQLDYLNEATAVMQPAQNGYLLTRQATSYQGWVNWGYVGVVTPF